jgi:hypothetical protein
MTPANPDEGRAETRFPVVANLGMATEFGGSIRADEPLRSEQLAVIGADTSTQLDWLDAIEMALSELRRRQVEDPGLSAAAAVAARLRAAIASSQAPANSTNVLWRYLYRCIVTQFLTHFSSAVGDDLGHETAHKIIEVLSSLARSLNL